MKNQAKQRILPNYTELGGMIGLGYTVSFGFTDSDGDVAKVLSKEKWDAVIKAVDPLDHLTTEGSWAKLGDDPLSVIDNAIKVVNDTHAEYIKAGGDDYAEQDPSMPLNEFKDSLANLRSIFLTGKPPTGSWLEDKDLAPMQTKVGEATPVPNKQGLDLVEYTTTNE